MQERALHRLRDAAKPEQREALEDARPKKSFTPVNAKTLVIRCELLLVEGGATGQKRVGEGKAVTEQGGYTPCDIRGYERWRVVFEEAMDCTDGTLPYMQQERPFRNAPVCCAILRSWFWESIAPEDEELWEMWTNKVWTEGHEGRDASPRNLDLDLGDLNVVLACAFEDLDGHIEHLGADVVRDIERTVGNDGKKRRETISVSQCAKVDIGGCSRCSQRGNIALQLLHDAEKNFGQAERCRVAETTQRPCGIDADTVAGMGEKIEQWFQEGVLPLS